MYISGSGPAPTNLALEPCRRHRELMWTCPPEAVACHAGPLADEADIFQGPNRVLAFTDQLRGSRLIRRTDLHDIDDGYDVGRRVVTLHTNDELFLDDNLRASVAFVVTELDLGDGMCLISVFVTERMAVAHFERATQP